MTKIEEYEAKKVEVEKEIESVKREIIIAEQNISQQEQVLMEQFGTTDLNKLKEIAENYTKQIEIKEKELADLESGIIVKE